MEKGDLEVSEVFNLLESSNVECVQEIKAEINETFGKTKENWLVTGLFDYYLATGSGQCAEILVGISKEPHDKFLIDKMTEGIRSSSKETRKQTLVFFGQVLSRQPTWLYKVIQQSLVKELIRLLKTETDVVVLLTGVLCVIIILPALASYISQPYMQDIFDVFGRLATWAQTSQNVPKEHILHLQVGLYSLFHRLYAMYPCNFLSYLRSSFGAPDKRAVFFHTIMPMLEKVKMHPALVTATREGEFNNAARWKSKDYHEVIAECSKISLDVYESSFPEEITPTFARLSSLDLDGEFMNDSSSTNTTGMTVESLLRLPTSSLISQAMQPSDLTSLVSYLDDGGNTAPPTPLSVGGPPSVLMNKAVSPPETAMEATPENTPMKDRDRVHFRMPPTSPAPAQLTFSNDPKHSGKPYLGFAPTPFNSVPSSPLPVNINSSGNTDSASAAGRPLVRRDSIFDSTNPAIAARRDSLIIQRLQKLQLERQDSTTEYSASTARAPVPFQQRKSSIPAPISIPAPSSQDDVVSSTTDASGGLTGPLTPMMMSGQSNSAGMLDPDLSLITLPEDSVATDCKTSSCAKGGLHMADHKQMIAFAKRVSRLRFHSQCADGASLPSPGTSPSSSSSSGMQNFRSRIKRSYSLPNIQQSVISEAEESALDTSTDTENDKHSSGGGACQSTEMKHPEPPTEQQPYEHLFQKILPTVLSPPVDSRTLQSPHLLLDLCLRKAASLHNNSRKSLDELQLLRGQVSLLHAQLLFERHRREAHSLRNRRLAGKVKEMQVLQEKNNSMRHEIHNLEKEVLILRQEVQTQKGLALNKEKELDRRIADLESKLESYRHQLSSLKDEKVQTEMKYSHLRDQHLALQKESDQKKADLFFLENEIKHLQKYADINSELKSAYENSQKEILLIGELLRYHQEAKYPPVETTMSYQEQIEDMRQTYEEEIRGLRNALDNRTSQGEAFHGMIQDLQKKLDKREAIIMEQRQNLHDLSLEQAEQIQEYQNKYESIKSENQKLELEILNLQHQLTLKTYSTRNARGRITSSPSNGDLSPTGNSNHSDVDSAASAAGYHSPDRNTCFFGSPQFDLPAEEMRDLQQSLDPAPSSSSRRGSSFQD